MQTNPHRLAKRLLPALAAGLPFTIAATSRAQSIPGAVLAAREPHHHLAYEDSTIRVLRVRVPPHDTTLLHEHDADYFWIALGASSFVNARLGAPDAVASSADLAIHYAPGHFAHVARNAGTTPFDNITVELLGAQTNVRNLCEPAVAGQPLDCAQAAERSGVQEHPAFATDQLRVSLLTIAPRARLRPAAGANGTWIIALDTLDAGHELTIERGGRWIGGTFHAAGRNWRIENRGDRGARALMVVSRMR